MLVGEFRGYSVERLMRFLVAAGQDVEIVVKPRKRVPPSFVLHKRASPVLVIPVFASAGRERQLTVALAAKCRAF